MRTDRLERPPGCRSRTASIDSRLRVISELRLGRIELAILARNVEAVRPVLPGWQAELRAAVRTPEELCRRLDLPAELAARAADGAGDFPVFVPPSFLRRIEPGDPRDPLLRQVLPVAAEGEDAAGFSRDPVDDSSATLEPGVLQKYAGRALLIATGVCAVHCRYCFRRHFPYGEAPSSDDAWEHALQCVAADEAIREVILSGGDPLMLVDERLRRLIAKIEAIPHVARLRVHTRLPIMVPTRITQRFCDALAESRLTAVLVLHANHAQELGEEVAVSLKLLQAAGVVLLNQAVLLRGVNDSADVQVALAERLLDVGVTPYYLHQLDRVSGGAHFEVPIKTGRAIVAEMRRRLPGYLVPRYVQDVPGQPHKVVLA